MGTHASVLVVDQRTQRARYGHQLNIGAVVGINLIHLAQYRNGATWRQQYAPNDANDVERWPCTPEGFLDAWHADDMRPPSKPMKKASLSEARTDITLTREDVDPDLVAQEAYHYVVVVDGHQVVSISSRIATRRHKHGYTVTFGPAPASHPVHTLERE